jgi:hypothetical protein
MPLEAVWLQIMVKLTAGNFKASYSLLHQQHRLAPYSFFHAYAVCSHLKKNVEGTHHHIKATAGILNHLSS